MVPNVRGWNKLELTCCTRTDLVTRGSDVEQPCYMPIDRFTHGSHCLELKRSRRTLLYGNGRRYTWLQLFRARTKWKKHVIWEWAPLRVVPTVWAEPKLNKLVTCTWTQLGSRTNLLHENGHSYLWFPVFGAKTKWKNLVACEWTRLRVVSSVWSRNEVERGCCTLMDTFTHGS